MWHSCEFGNKVIYHSYVTYTIKNYQTFLGTILLWIILIYFLFDYLTPFPDLLLHGKWRYVVVVLIPPRISHIYFHWTRFNSLVVYELIPVFNPTSWKTSDREMWASPFFLRDTNLRYPKLVVNRCPQTFPTRDFSLAINASVYKFFPNYCTWTSASIHVIESVKYP